MHHQRRRGRQHNRTRPEVAPEARQEVGQETRQEIVPEARQEIVPEARQEMLQKARALLFERTWSLRYGVDWKHVHDVCDIKTVADFWGIYNNIGLPGLSPIKCDFYMFHSGISSEWEAPANRGGGKWVINLGQDRRRSDDIWLHVLLGLVGEQYARGSSDFINGTSLHVRPGGIRGALWLSEVSVTDAQAIGDSIRTVAEIPEDLEMEFKWHAESITNGSCFNSSTVMRA